MPHVEAADLIQKFTSSPEFFQICIEIKRRLVTQSLERSWLQKRMARWLERQTGTLPTDEEMGSLYPKLYVAAMEAIAKRSFMMDEILEMDEEPGSEEPLFPNAPTSSTPFLDAVRESQQMPQAYGYEFGEQSFSPVGAPTSKHPLPDMAELLAGEQNHIVVRNAGAQASIPSHHSLPAALASKPRSALARVAVQEEPAQSSVSAQSITASASQMSLENHRFQSIVFEQGFYTLDRETGQAWFVQAGSHTMVPCGGTGPGGQSQDGLQRDGRAHESLASLSHSGSSLTSSPAHFDSTHGGHNSSVLSSQPYHSSPDNDVTPLSLRSLEEAASVLDSGEQRNLSHASLEAPIHAPNSASTSLEIDWLDTHVEPAQPDSPPATNPMPISALDDSDSSFLSPHSPAFREAATPLPKSAAKEAKEKIGSFEREPVLPQWHEAIVETYPLPIAYTYRSFLHETDPRVRLRLLVLVLFQILKYSSYPLVLRFLERQDIDDMATYDAVSRLQSSSWAAWLDFLRCAATSMSTVKDPLVQDILASYRRLETERPVEDKFLYTQRFLDPLGEERVTYLQLGLLEAMVLFRESFVHGFTPTYKQAENELRVYEPLLFEILQDMDWMRQYPLYYSWESDKDDALAYPLHGAEPVYNDEPLRFSLSKVGQSEPSLFLTSATDPDYILPMFPLMLAQDILLNDPPLPGGRHAILLFEGNSGSQLIYHNLWQTPSLRSRGIEWWRERLQQNSFSPPLRDFSENQIYQRVTRWTLSQLDRLSLNQQFFPDLAEERSGMERWLRDFLASEHQLFVFHASSGIGKTTTSARLAHHGISQRHPVIWLNGSSLLTQPLLELLARVLGLSTAKHSPSPDGLARCIADHISPEKPLLIVLDNLELLPKARERLLGLDSQIASLIETSLRERVKFVVGLGSEELWEWQREGPLFAKSAAFAMTHEDALFQLRPASWVCELPPLNSEELSWMYEHYRTYDNGHGIHPFSPQTSWNEISITSPTRSTLRYPQLLRLATATFCGQVLPDSLEVSDLMDQMMAHVIEERYAPLPVPERLHFVDVFAEQLLHSDQEFLTRDGLLRSQQAPLLRALQNPHSDSPLVQLIHLGLLTEDWQDGKSCLHFASPLVQSFFLARALIHHSVSKGTAALLPDLEGDAVPRNVQRTYRFVWLHLLRNGQIQELVEWLHKHFALLDPYVEEFVLFIARTNLTHWLGFVDELLQVENEGLVRCMLVVIERLWFSNDEEAALALAEHLARFNMDKETQRHLQHEILYRQARLCEVLHRMDEAEALYHQAETFAESAGDSLVLSQIFSRLSSLARSQKRMEEAMVWLERGQELLEECDMPRRLARMIRQQGNLAYQQGDLSRALLCYQHSLRIDESYGNVRGMAASLSNLGTVFGSRSDFETALMHYQRCLFIHQSLGDRKNVATTLNNIGIIYKIQQDWEQALDVFQSALVLRKEMGLLRDSVSSIHHIASIWEQQGEVEEALKALKEGKSIQHQLGHWPGVAEILLRMGHLAYRQGRSHEATSLFEELLQMDDALGQGRFHAEAWYALGLLRWDGGSLESSLQALQQADAILLNNDQKGLRAAVARASARVLMEMKEWLKAEHQLEIALQRAEDSLLPQERLECMLEWGHFCLIRSQEDAALALIDRIQVLSEGHQDSPQILKDLLCLKLRHSFAMGKESKGNSQLEDLQQKLVTLAHDENVERTTWALVDAANYFLTDSPDRSRTLAIQAERMLPHRSSSSYEAVERLLEELDLNPNKSNALQEDTDTYPSLNAALTVISSEDGPAAADL